MLIDKFKKGNLGTFWPPKGPSDQIEANVRILRTNLSKPPIFFRIFDNRITPVNL
jgi:hypothetical protein